MIQVSIIVDGWYSFKPIGDFGDESKKESTTIDSIY